jgi:hypothetical protein
MRAHARKARECARFPYRSGVLYVGFVVFVGYHTMPVRFAP